MAVGAGHFARAWPDSEISAVVEAIDVVTHAIVGDT
jgi:hypothetical protein